MITIPNLIILNLYLNKKLLLPSFILYQIKSLSNKSNQQLLASSELNNPYQTLFCDLSIFCFIFIIYINVNTTIACKKRKFLHVDYHHTFVRGAIFSISKSSQHARRSCFSMSISRRFLAQSRK